MSLTTKPLDYTEYTDFTHKLPNTSVALFNLPS